MTTRLVKNTIPFILLAACLGVLALTVWGLVVNRKLPDVKFLADPRVSLTIRAPDWEGHPVPFTVGPGNPDWVPLELIPKDLQNAVLAGEDFSFYSHNGVDWYELYESFKRNFREHRFSRGGSTITQQLAKNLFLSREKTIRRKIKELILADRLEKALTKDRILELYLNLVELGDTVYGVGAGARRHFGRRPSELSLRESAFLAAMLPGPRVYDPDHNMDRVMNRSDHLLGVMLKARWITEDQYLDALVEVPYPYRNEENPPAAQEEAGEPATDPAMETEGSVLTGNDELTGAVGDTADLFSKEIDDGKPLLIPDEGPEPAEAVPTGGTGVERAVSDTNAPSPQEVVPAAGGYSGAEGIIEIPIRRD